MKRVLVFMIILTAITAAASMAASPTPGSYPNMWYDIYVDANTSNTWASEAVSYPLLSDWSYGSDVSTGVLLNLWYRNTGSSAAINGTVFQGQGTGLPQLTMTANGLNAAKTYNVYAVCWTRHDGSFYWYTMAGLNGGLLWVCDDKTEYDNIFSTSFVVKGCQLFLGQVSNVSSVSVNIDGPALDNSGYNRAWFDGLAFVETTAGPYVTLNINCNITDPCGVAQKPLDGSVIDISPAQGLHTLVQGTRVQIAADNNATNCPDILDFKSFSGDVSGTSNVVNVKASQNKTVNANYVVRKYTPACGDICHPLTASDTNGDCNIDLEDFGNIAINWLVCTKPECD
jgi:hypothetical protein